MEDMRYDQYGAPMGYQPMGILSIISIHYLEKQQGGYMNRNIPGMYFHLLFINSGTIWKYEFRK